MPGRSMRRDAQALWEEMPLRGSPRGMTQPRPTGTLGICSRAPRSSRATKRRALGLLLEWTKAGSLPVPWTQILGREPLFVLGPEAWPPASLLGVLGAGGEVSSTSEALVCGHVSRRVWCGVRGQ